jgi:hypothetical protein
MIPKRRSSRLVTCAAPEVFYLRREEQRAKLFDFLDRVDLALQSGHRVRLEFGKASELHPCGTLLFMARLDGWLDAFPNKLSATYPSDDIVEQLLQHVNVLQQLGLAPRKVVSHERVQYWNFHFGVDVRAATYKELTRLVVERIEHPSQLLFADCLHEAVTNAVNHAYEGDPRRLPPESQRKWWMLSQVRSGHLFVAIYDVGVGIPNSLRTKPGWIEYLRVRRYNDSRLIKAAIVSNLTVTHMPHRGKGLPEMLEFSKELRAGGLSIWSGDGGVTYDATTERQGRHEFDSPLRGTLVLWEIPFLEEHLNEHADDFSN